MGSETLHFNIGIVIIGRNEGDRLKICLKSIIDKSDRIVYVDSGSTDGSAEYAQSLGIEVIRLDNRLPYTAARGRNAGLKKYSELVSEPEFVQFIDGDCELNNNWLDVAIKEIQSNQEFAVVFGRRREIYPDSTLYNRITDMEWNVPEGEVESCGGDALFRMKAIKQVNGYNVTLIAGEEPEMCLRMRREGWKIICIKEEMTKHDANIRKFRQWWRRSVRCGFAYAEGLFMHGKSEDRYRFNQVRSVVLWGLMLPLTIVCISLKSLYLCIIPILMYIVLWYKIRTWRLSLNDSKRNASIYAFFLVISKFAELQGIIRFALNRIFGKKNRIIEYKESK